MIVRYAACTLLSPLPRLMLLLLALLAHLVAVASGHAPLSETLPRLSNRSFFQISPKSIVSDACASYSTLEKLNGRITPYIKDLTETTDFFSHYRVNLFHKKCPFWNDENGMCGNIACAVETLDNEEDIPLVWRASELGKLQGPSAEHPGKIKQKERPRKPLQGRLGENVGESCVVEYDDECDERDYCIPEDESASSKGDYVSLLANPERFTGYAGEGANQVWESIYRENCFQKSSFPGSAQLGQPQTPKNPAALDFRNVLEAAGRQQVLEHQRQADPNVPFVAKTGLEVEDECIEKRVFYRVISGMHASISTHLCYDYLNQMTGKWSPNVTCYVNRLHGHPERISNLYFNYALVTRAIAKLGPHLQAYTFCSGDADQDAATKAKALAVTQAAGSVPQIFDESLMFKNGEGPSLKEDFRGRFRNVSRLMDCVGCDKCRLWGKVQTAGYGAALKVLFEFDNDSGEVPVLQRTELVALFNTYGRLTNSLNAIQHFRTMVQDAETPDSSDATKVVEEVRVVVEELPAAVKGSPQERPNQSFVVPREPVTSQTTEEEHEQRKKPAQEESIKDIFYEEFGEVIDAFRIIGNRYLSFPSLLWNITTSELMRAGQAFIGVPVSPRIWTFGLPSKDEL